MKNTPPKIPQIKQLLNKLHMDGLTDPIKFEFNGGSDEGYSELASRHPDKFNSDLGELESLVMQYLPWEGWWDGGYGMSGTITLDPATLKIKLDYYQAVEQRFTEEY